ncbi:DUF3138 family protein [Chromobacterium haemolyticum]|nr:DUF3138 family protein [Chromobacterium haemolyticum]
MKRILISALIAGLPGMALADAKADELAKLKAQLQALQSQMQALQQAVAAATEAKAPADEANADLKERVAGMELKVDKLNNAATDGPLAGLSVTGYLDPTYIYNRANNSSGFQFLNHQNTYAYSNSTFGDVYLDIKKTFGVGPTAPSAEISIMPNRGSGNTLLDGGSGNNIINTAQFTYPLSDTWSLTAGLVNSFGGYEMQQSNQMTTLTHGLLYDFSVPGSYVGAGFNWAHGDWAWKFMLGNEQYRTHANLASTGSNGDTGNPIVKSNNTPTLTGRVDYTWSSALDLGWSFNARPPDAADQRRPVRQQSRSGEQRLSGRQQRLWLPVRQQGPIQQLLLYRSRRQLHLERYPVQRRVRLRTAAERRLERRRGAMVRGFVAWAPQMGDRSPGQDGRHLALRLPEQQQERRRRRRRRAQMPTATTASTGLACRRLAWPAARPTARAPIARP